MKTAEKKEHCPIACASKLIGDMWVILIVRDLLKGALRFTELQKSLVSSDSQNMINSKTLTDRLKMLEELEIVTRTEFTNEMPPRVEYTLTKKGEALSPIVEDIRKYGEKYFK